MENVWGSLIGQIGICFTALCTLIGIVIQVHSNGKAKKTEDLTKGIDTKIDNLRKDSENADEKIRNKMCENLKILEEKLNANSLRYYKDQLVRVLSKIEDGYKPTNEEFHILYEQKAKYNELGRR